MTTPPRPVAQRFPKTTLGVAFVIGLGVGAFVSCGEDGNGPIHAAPRVMIPVHDTTPTRLAVLVGIAHYAESSECPVANLPGPANDVSLVKKLLMDRFAFQERDIVTLEDKLATHRNIVDVFHRHLIQKAGPETEVVFWFSGHGSRTKDRSGREKGGMDSTLLAYDSRAIAPDGGYDITDDEMRSLLEALAERTSRITLITDNCHSGGVVRGSDNNNNTATRGVAAGTSALMHERVAAFWPGAIPLLDDDDKRRVDISRRFVHVAACTRDQLARGWRVPQESGQDRHYGTLTWFLVAALNRAQKGESWRDVLLRVQLLLSCHRPGQTPVPDGNCDRMVFGGDFKPRPDGLVAMPLGGDRLSIRGGSLHGLCVGSTLELRKPFGPKALGQAKVEFVHPDGVRSMARWTGGRPDAVQEDQALWATETSRPQNLPPLRLHVEVVSPELATSLEKSAWVKLVSRAEAAYLLSKTGEGDANMRLQQVDGPVLWQGEAEALDAAFQHELRYQAVMRLPMQPGSLKLSAKFAEPTSKELNGSDFGEAWNFTPVAIRRLQDSPRLGQEPPPASQHHYQAEAGGPEDFPQLEGKPPSGELAVLEVTNASEREVHLYVISLEESRTAVLVWPRSQKGETLKPGKSRRVPIWLVGNKAFGERSMRDRYVILGTLAQFNAEELIKNESEPTRSAGAPVPAILQQALAAKNDTTRGDSGNQVPVRERNWGSTWLDVHVQYKAPKNQKKQQK